MILLFGGTTEGRMAINELEEAGSPFFYSTKTGEQDVALSHGTYIHGAMDGAAMAAFCREHGVRLLVDAAHPFAAELHQTVADTAQQLGLPAIRYERIFPPRAADIVWLDNYDEAVDRIDTPSLLATTGVQSIARLKPLERRGVRVVYRILPRESSIRLAHQQGATDDQLCFYEDETALDTPVDGILLKESGLTGGFQEKVEAARARNMKIFAIRRPTTPAYFHLVNGPHGLRRMVEKLLPDFFPLKSGLTTGTCATAAAIAALQRSTFNVQRSTFNVQCSMSEVPVQLPNGETIPVPVGYGDGYAYCIKEAGDDPDVTNGLEIRATITLGGHASERDSSQPSRIEIRGGEGVGRFTLPGFDYPPGEAAINRAPRAMIRNNLERILPTEMDARLVCTISVPGGEEIAKRTFNPRLGIEGGISIIGVSGIVKPFSEEAFVDSIRKCMVVAKASGTDRVVLNSGAKSERFLKARYPDLPQQAFVQYGNFIGATLKMADELQFAHVTLGVMLGKAVKLAEGQMDTHSRKGTMNLDFIRQMLHEARCDTDLTGITLARELWERIPSDKIGDFVSVVAAHCAAHCQPLLPKARLTLLLIADDGTIHSQ